MSASSFISSRLHFQGRISVWATAVSFVIITVSLAVAGGFRYEIRRSISESLGDITLESVRRSSMSETDSIQASPSCLDLMLEMPGVKSIRPIVCRAGVVKSGGEIYGVVVKGIEDPELGQLSADIPSEMAAKLELGISDSFVTYIIGENVKARRFTVHGIYDSPIEAKQGVVIYTGIDDVRRVNGWGSGSASALEVRLDGDRLSRSNLKRTALELGSLAMIGNKDGEEPLTAISSADQYSQIFDWLELIDSNVTAILILMIIVAGFNMISGLLIMLFRNVRTIGELKTMGMTDRGISAIFFSLASRAVLKGMIAGNLLALVICAVQKHTHVMKLNPENYFLSFVPMDIDPAVIIMTDAISFAAICILLLIPTKFISKVDPSRTVNAS